MKSGEHCAQRTWPGGYYQVGVSIPSLFFEAPGRGLRLEERQEKNLVGKRQAKCVMRKVRADYECLLYASYFSGALNVMLPNPHRLYKNQWYYSHFTDQETESQKC